MEVANELALRITGNMFLIYLAIPAFLTVICFTVFRKRAEFSKLAIMNTFATLVLAGANIGLLVWFVEDVNTLAQAAYDSLYIPTLPASFWGSTPLLLTVVFGLVARDFCDYWSHRLMHTRIGWATHAAHHSDTHVNAFTSFRVHILEYLLMNFSYIILLTWLQIPETLPFVVLLAFLHNIYVHMDLPFQHGRCKLLLASPVFHRWHHADTPAAHGKNLANMFPIFDFVFGTYYEPGLCHEQMGATKSKVNDTNPVAIFIYPFTYWGRMVRRALSKSTAKPSENSGVKQPVPTYE